MTTSDLAGLPEWENGATTSGTYAGISRTQYPEFSSRIRISQEVIEDSRNSQGAFAQAAQAEWQAVINGMRQQMDWDISRPTGNYDMHYRAWDPDMEMDIGL